MNNIFFKYFWILGILLGIFGCKDDLEVTPPGQFAPGNVFSSEEGINALLNSSYQYSNRMQGYKSIINVSEVMTDMAFNSGGGENRTLSLFINYTFDASVDLLAGDFWTSSYKAIRDANLVLDNIDNSPVKGNTKEILKAEARFIRAMEYANLYNWFGTVPLVTTSEDGPMPRASVEEITSFIETELNEAALNLPAPGEEKYYGKATKGAAYGILAKYYLNTKQWQKAADAAQAVIDLDYYELWDNYKTLFRVENEPQVNPDNKEMIFVYGTIVDQNYSNNFLNGALPPKYASSEEFPEFVFNSGMANWATQYRLRSAFFESFDPADERRTLILTKYVNTAGVEIDLSKNIDDYRSFKYFDNNAVGNFHGNDFPVLRYADILLTRAEALNEIDGPTQEALDLINEVRNRAELEDILLADVADKTVLRDMILAERGWEFYSEAKRREDLIRHGKLISMAQDRGVNAKDYHVLYPLPEVEISSNGSLSQEDQNPGY